MNSSVALKLCERTIRLDKLYLVADAASWDWIRSKSDTKTQRRLYQRQQRLWQRYHKACQEPMPS